MTVAEAATIAEEIVVQGTVETVLDAAQLAVALTRADVAADRNWQMLGANCMSHLRL